MRLDEAYEYIDRTAARHFGLTIDVDVSRPVCRLPLELGKTVVFNMNIIMSMMRILEYTHALPPGVNKLVLLGSTWMKFE